MLISWVAGRVCLSAVVVFDGFDFFFRVWLFEAALAPEGPWFEARPTESRGSLKWRSAVVVAAALLKLSCPAAACSVLVEGRVAWATLAGAVAIRGCELWCWGVFWEYACRYSR